ncbi:MAG: NAD(P)-binding protein [Hydrogenophaga sp.]|uniref:NAD(P)/FAD-dependent oxidoreductase n=1 Tax=Hydrogenophaga sp. TaxID=1904254 RepID=UPI0016A25FC8|nr:FAD-dependent oxidoreductase [Hydrogenophaga sp.]NIM39780.1 NAD(P)-binding protein [Hydrogenophaga sp.]NIN24984.1 NAD(P)-binding protein [Hydrogenophaga sp.]NIN29496.1 NAD(P)-binding protein [Hydrogenophaga sp.]NIN54019.1 NAD(P)-binding protein [Hydrogenophaga sp.]NIO50223.1 NAD(P)-binding protein [Hydrogenophaga sp.]
MSPGASPHQARVAVVGSGIAGLAAAHTLQGLADITLFEGSEAFGGQTRTLDVALPDATGAKASVGLDAGFLVLDERTSPNLLALFTQLGVPLAASEGSFSVQVPGTGLAWSSTDLAGVFTQRRLLASLRFWRMLADARRFKRACAALARPDSASDPDNPLLQPLDGFLRERHFSSGFREDCLLPLLSGLWGCPVEEVLSAPLLTAARFLSHHDVLRLGGRSRWFTVAGGARPFVQAIVAGIGDARLSTPVRHVARDAQGVRVVTDAQVERFDAVVLACHADQALAVLGEDASDEERATLGAIRFPSRRAVLHTDTSVLPAALGAWAAWNCEPGGLHCLLNRTQPLPMASPLLASYGGSRAIAPERVLGAFDVAHPVFDLEAVRAQFRLPALQGRRHTWYAGAWCGDGFHEDGLKAGLHAARALIDRFDLVPRISERRALRQALPGVLA